MIGYEIEVEERSDVVGEIHSHSWDDEILYLDLKEEKGQEEVTEDKLEDILFVNGWTTEHVDYHSSHSVLIIENSKELECSECNSEPMYDSEVKEWYCPVCENDEDTNNPLLAFPKTISKQITKRL